MPLMSPPFPPLPPNAVVYVPPPSWTVMCSWAIELRTTTAQACHTQGTVGGRGCPPPLLPQCPRCAKSISESSYQSMSPHGHYIPQLLCALAPLFSETPSCKSWAIHPHLLLITPVLEPPLPHRVGFVSTQSVTPYRIPSRTQDIWTAPSVSSCISSLIPSSAGYRFHLTVTQPPAWMAYYPHCFWDISLQPNPVKYSCQRVKWGMDPLWVGGGNHPVICIEKRFLQLQSRMPFVRPLQSIVARPGHMPLRLYRFVAAAVVPVFTPIPFCHQGFLVVDHCIHHHI